MTEYRPCQGCLVLYKTRPAIVTEIGEKIDIRLDGGKQKRVRPKDIHLLHPGPVDSLSLAQPVPGDVEEAWELVSGVRTHLQELAGLIYGEYTPETAWATWQLVKEGLWFEGEPDAIVARSREQVEKDRARRQAREQAAREWSGFLERLAARRLEPADRERLQEVERLALGQTGQSRILQALGRQETPAAAHRLLTAVGYWQGEHNPWPARSGMPARNPELAVPELPAEVQRLDLTALPAFAIDDEGNQDPDDAISLDGDRIWVHVADVAALAPPDSALDLEARARAANLYLPEGVVHMLPPLLTTCLGLGLQARSPALSIGFRVTSDARLEAVEIRSSWVRVSRCSYAEVDRRLDEAPFAHLARLARRFRERRQEQGAVRLDLPEVSVKLAPGGEVLIRPLPRMESREMVMELMLMAGEAVARYAVANALPVPFATQAAPAQPQPEGGLASMYAFRRQLKPSQITTLEKPHAGLGLALYCRVTSPLRRYLDLVTHQQLRAHLRGEPPLSLETVSTRIAETEQTARAVRRAERESNLHWKLVYLQRHAGWRGRGVVVESDPRRSTLLIPELALETRLRSGRELALDTQLEVAVTEVDLAEQQARFRQSGRF